MGPGASFETFSFRTFSSVLLFAALLSSIVFAPSLSIAADALQILPTRVVLQKERSAELNLINKGDSTGVYRIILRNLRTTDTGQFQMAETPYADERFAHKMVRYSPRQVTIPPKSNQKVRLVVRKPRQLLDGEYRTHMVFQSIPQQQGSVYDDSDDVQIALAPIVEVTIPVIIRHGNVEASATLDQAYVQDNVLHFQLQRAGNRSLYGDVEVLQSTSKNRLTFVRGISVYVPNALRIMQMPLPDHFSAKNGPIDIVFKEDPNYGGKAQSVLTINPF